MVMGTGVHGVSRVLTVIKQTRRSCHVRVTTQSWARLRSLSFFKLTS